MKERSGSRTMLTSLLMSAPGPIILGVGLTMGQSATQVADFTRRTAELLALVIAYAVYMLTLRPNSSPEENHRLERLSNLVVGSTICLSGAVMLALALLGRSNNSEGSLLALIIAALGMIANSIFWLRYTKLSRETGNTILAVQGRLYRGKALVDICVTGALTAVILLPGSPVSGLLDRGGSAVVAINLVLCGIRTIGENSKKG